MTRFVIDPPVALRLAEADFELPATHELLAPTLIRSQTLSLMHEAVHRGELSADLARERLGRFNRLPLRLLGDAVLRRVAWEIADRLGWAATYDAEYIALTRLQGDALVTLNPELANAAAGIVEIAPLEALSRG